MATQQLAKDDRSLGDLFSALASETASLVRSEVALAQVELTQKATNAGKNVGSLAVGGAIAYLAVLALTAALIMGLSYLIPAWLAAALVGVVFAAVSYFLVSSALAELKKINPVPEQTAQTIKEDARWLKKEMS
ncbi:MAG: phage holin family protein [Pyrinomonadaceae bacterium]